MAKTDLKLVYYYTFLLPLNSFTGSRRVVSPKMTIWSQTFARHNKLQECKLAKPTFKNLLV